MRSPTINPHLMKYAIMTAIEKIYPDLPESFYGWYLHGKVIGQIEAGKSIYIDTTLRYLRQLREDKKLNYDVIKRKSLYIKK